MTRRIPRKAREQIREHARFRCEYCLIHEDDVIFRHVPDHVIARKHGGGSELANLAWSCYLCNHLKGSDIASVDLDTGRIVRLFHPRRDAWGTHFRLQGARIVPLTAVGRVTEHLLQLNQQRSLDARQALLEEGRYPG
jgi:hypothetical protein